MEGFKNTEQKETTIESPEQAVAKMFENVREEAERRINQSPNFSNLSERVLN